MGSVERLKLNQGGRKDRQCPQYPSLVKYYMNWYSISTYCLVVLLYLVKIHENKKKISLKINWKQNLSLDLLHV